MFLMFLKFCNCEIFAQIDSIGWAPVGATWLYISPGLGANYYYKLKYLSDTMIQNRITKKISYSTFAELQAGIFSKESFIKNYYYTVSNDTLYWYNKNRFDFLYDFSARVGDKWVIHQNLNDPFLCADTIIKRDTSQVYIVGKEEKFFSGKKFSFYYATNGSYWSVGSFIVKNIGSTRFGLLFPSKGVNCFGLDSGAGDVESSVISCYYDSKRGFIDFSPSQQGVSYCTNFITETSEVANNLVSEPSQLNLVVSPNPSSQKLYFKINGEKITQIKIFNLIGKEYYVDPDFIEGSIDITRLPNSIYLLQTNTASNYILSSKFEKIQ